MVDPYTLLIDDYCGDPSLYTEDLYHHEHQPSLSSASCSSVVADSASSTSPSMASPLSFSSPVTPEQQWVDTSSYGLSLPFPADAFQSDYTPGKPEDTGFVGAFVLSRSHIIVC